MLAIYSDGTSTHNGRIRLLKKDGLGNFTGQDLATERQNVKPQFVADSTSDGDKNIVANKEDYWVILLDNDSSENFTEGARVTAF